MPRLSPPVIAAWIAVVLSVAAGAAVDASGAPSPGATAVDVAARSVPAAVPADRVDGRSAGAAPFDDDADVELGPPAPTAVSAPAVGLLAPLVAVGKTPDGALAVPDFGTAGWYQHSPRPGAVGSAVLAGHVDSHTGPDVFHALEELDVGDEVVVHHADGTASTFVVHHRESTPKDALPVARIFDQPMRPELRLITCGGDFDRSTRSYEENVIVYARLADDEMST